MDVILRRKVERMELDITPCNPITFHTANGTTVADHTVEIKLGSMDNKATVQVLDDTPSVFSMGQRCVEEAIQSFGLIKWPIQDQPGWTED